MPLIQGFQSTSIWKAFVLNSIAASLVIFVAMTIKSELDTYRDKRGHIVVRKTNIVSVVSTLVITFIASMAAFTILHIVFGYGRGQLEQV